MVALYRCGRQADSLRAYQRAREALVDVGLEPGPALRRLEAAVLSQDPSLEGPARVRRAGNLPVALTELVGRKQEVADLRLLLGVHRLVTIVGPGGAGKTRLAVEVARSFGHEAADGVWIVELSPVDRAAVVSATASALGVQQVGAHADPTVLAGALAGRHLLLVVDNCEHVIDAAAQMVHRRAPEVRVLATSREALGVEGEHRFLLPPLDIEAAVELFAERVESAGGSSPLSDDVSRGLAFDICSRLDGLPLAVELAASRAAHLDAQEVVRRLDDRFRLLPAACARPSRASRRFAPSSTGVGICSTTRNGRCSAGSRSLPGRPHSTPPSRSARVARSPPRRSQGCWAGSGASRCCSSTGPGAALVSACFGL